MVGDLHAHRYRRSHFLLAEREVTEHKIRDLLCRLLAVRIQIDIASGVESRRFGAAHVLLESLILDKVPVRVPVSRTHHGKCDPVLRDHLPVDLPVKGRDINTAAHRYVFILAFVLHEAVFAE